MNDKPLTHTNQLRTAVKYLTINELCFDEDMFYDQECFWACRYGGHAVYCHNQENGMPMKCNGRGKTDCAGFKENEIINPTESEE